jgi:hypothetical protein
MKHFRRAAVAALVLATMVMSAGTALAVAPGNDVYGGRSVVGAIPFTDSLDTTEATTDSNDSEINATCGAPATDASVWYDVTAVADGGLAADVSSSTYSAGVIVATGSPGNWSLVACGPGAVGWTATAGTTYAILVFDDQADGAGNGGTLNLAIDAIPAPPTVDITVNRFAAFNSGTGSATVSGTLVCTGAEFAAVETSLSQRVGRFTIHGFGFGSSGAVCDGTVQTWTAEVLPENGTFAGGKAATVAVAFACGAFQCGIGYEERTVQLRGRA